MIPPVYILAGGKSSRFGSNKARAMLDGQPLIVHQAKQWRELGLSVFAIAQQSDEYGDLAIETIPDMAPDRGPVMGIYTALCHRAKQSLATTDTPDIQDTLIANASLSTHQTNCPWVLMTTCDMVGKMEECFSSMRRWIETQRKELSHPRSMVFCDDQVQPFPGLYHLAFRANARALLEADRPPSVRSFLQSMGEDLAQIKIEARHWTHVNTQAELAEWLKEP